MSELMKGRETMRYKKLRCADIEVSEMTVGTWVMAGRNYGEITRSDAIRSIRAMVERGINVIDTAPVYGNGASEQVVGDALEGLAREKLILVTKFGLPPYIYNRMGARDLSYRNVIREVSSSLTNLNTDYIDIYMIHYPDPSTPIFETMDALNRLKDQGYIRYIGVSNFTQEQVEEAQKYGKIDIIQMAYSMVNRVQEPLLKWCCANAIDVMSYGSLGSGILSGAIRSTPDFVGKKDIRATFYGELYKEPKFSNIMKLLEKMDIVAEAHQKPVAQVAINWSTQKAFMTTILVGVRNEKEVAENCAAFEWELSDEEVASLDNALIELDI